MWSCFSFITVWYNCIWKNTDTFHKNKLKYNCILTTDQEMYSLGNISIMNFNTCDFGVLILGLCNSALSIEKRKHINQGKINKIKCLLR